MTSLFFLNAFLMGDKSTNRTKYRYYYQGLIRDIFLFEKYSKCAPEGESKMQKTIFLSRVLFPESFNTNIWCQFFDYKIIFVDSKPTTPI